MSLKNPMKINLMFNLHQIQNNLGLNGVPPKEEYDTMVDPNVIKITKELMERR